MRETLRAVVVVAVALAFATSANSQECGDVVGHRDGVSTSDALAVLRKAVGQSVQLDCASGECTALENRTAALEAGSLVVKDASGNTLGRFISIDYDVDSSFTIYVAELGKFVNLRRGSEIDGKPIFELGYAPAVRYSNSTCDGSPWAILNWKANIPPNQIIGVARRAFVPTSAKPKPHVWNAKIGDPSGDCIEQSTPADISASDNDGAGAYYLSEVSLPFELPVVGPLSIEPLR